MTSKMNYLPCSRQTPAWLAYFAQEAPNSLQNISYLVIVQYINAITSFLEFYSL